MCQENLLYPLFNWKMLNKNRSHLIYKRDLRLSFEMRKVLLKAYFAITNFAQQRLCCQRISADMIFKLTEWSWVLFFSEMQSQLHLLNPFPHECIFAFSFLTHKLLSSPSRRLLPSQLDFAWHHLKVGSLSHETTKVLKVLSRRRVMTFHRIIPYLILLEVTDKRDPWIKFKGSQVLVFDHWSGFGSKRLNPISWFCVCLKNDTKLFCLHHMK